MNRIRSVASLAAALFGSAASAQVTLYLQNFENPTGFVNDGGDVNIFRSVNQLYGDQPAGFRFGQTNTVETLLVGGSQAWGRGFADPDGRAGRYTLGMLSTVQNDFLGLSFNVGSYDFLNFQLDISSIDLDRWSGPFVSAGAIPTFRFSLFDNPTGSNGVGSGRELSFVEISGLAGPNDYTFAWSNVVAGLSTQGNTNGNVTLRIDMVNGGYGALDNFVIAASDVQGEIPGGIPNPLPGVPEPGTWATVLGGLGALALARRRRVTTTLS
jgi:hypothetical protein